MRFPNIFRTALVLGLACATTTAYAGIVVASSGPSAKRYPVGSKVDDNGQIALQAGDSVTVLGQTGTRVLRGPGTVAVSQPGGASSRSVFNAFTRQGAASKVRTGAVRSATTVNSSSPNLWFIDANASGTHCVANPTAVALSRKDGNQAAKYTVKWGTSSTTTADFARGALVAGWSGAVPPLANGDTLWLMPASSKAAPTEVKIVRLTDVPQDPEALAAALLAQGCGHQVDRLAATLAAR